VKKIVFAIGLALLTLAASESSSTFGTQQSAVNMNPMPTSLLRPAVPESASLVLLGTAMFLFARRARRRPRRDAASE
jgi:hypothetical protein